MKKSNMVILKLETTPVYFLVEKRIADKIKRKNRNKEITYSSQEVWDSSLE